jgi:hypothetical protein
MPDYAGVRIKIDSEQPFQTGLQAIITLNCLPLRGIAFAKSPAIITKLLSPAAVDKSVGIPL